MSPMWCYDDKGYNADANRYRSGSVDIEILKTRIKEALEKNELNLFKLH